MKNAKAISKVIVNSVFYRINILYYNVFLFIRIFKNLYFDENYILNKS